MDVEKCLAGKNIFLTGGSGFIGKVMIEKILRTIPDVGKIFILLRKKKGKRPEDRIKDIFNNSLFEKLKRTNPDVFKKVVIIEGNVLELKIGINERDWETLMNNVNIIYHCAASIRFDDYLKSAILTNIRSTREVIQLALESKHLKAFIHVSTAYCNVREGGTEMEEKMYPQNGDWRQAIELAEKGDPYVSEIFTQKYIHPMPNTYTYTKSLAEHVVYEMCMGKIPAVIVRPTVVINMLREPVPGWTDNLNGPIGLCVALIKGILRTAYVDEKIFLDIVPVDASVNALLMITSAAVERQNSNTVEVYNNSRHMMSPRYFKQTNIHVKKHLSLYPLCNNIWYPRTTFTKCKYMYFIRVLLLHMLPAVLLDSLAKFAGMEPRLVKIQKKAYIANVVLKHFMFNCWTFPNFKLLELEKTLSPANSEKFGYSQYFEESELDFVKYLQDCIIRIDTDLLNQKPDYTNNKRIIYRLWFLDIAAKIVLASLIILIMIKTNIFGKFYHSAENYFTNL